MAEEIGYELVVTRTDEAVAEFQKVQRAQQEAASSAEEMGSSQRQVAQQVTASQSEMAGALRTAMTEWGQLGAAAGQAGAVVGRLGPEFGRLGGLIGQAGQSVQGVVNALASPSPASLVSALVSVASTLIDAIGTWNEYRASMRQAMEAARDAARTEEQLAHAIRDRREATESARAPLELDRAAAAVQARRLELVHAEVAVNAVRSEGSAEEFRRAEAHRALMARALTRAEEQHQAISDQMAQQSASAARTRGETERMAAAERERAQILAEQEAILSEQEGLREERRARGGGRDGYAEAIARYDEALRRGLQMERGFAAESKRMQEEFLDARAVEEEQKAQDRVQSEINAIREADRVAGEIHEEKIRRFEEEKRAAAEVTAQIQADATTVLAPAIGGITDALTAIIAGTESAEDAFMGMLSGFLEALAQQATLEAIKEYAAAVGSFASYDYTGGALHLAAGVAWTAVAVAAGAGAAATKPAAAAPASPEAGEGAAPAGGGGTNVYNINGTIISAGGHTDRARAGREVGAVVRAGDKRYGMAS